MFSKFFFATLVCTLALSAFSSESTQAGRYRVEGPSNSGGTSTQAGRYRVAVDNGGSFATQQSQDNWSQPGQSRMAGRYQSSQSEYAQSRSYNYAPDSHEMRTQRNPSVDVMAKPSDRATQPERK